MSERTLPQPACPRRGAALLVAGGLLAALGLAWLVPWHWGRRAATRFPMDQDPRRSYATPYRNVRPEVGYVGDAACAACHADIAERFRHHPMGRSLAPVAEEPAEPAAKEAQNPFGAGGFQYAIEYRGRRLFHKETRTDPQDKPIYELAAEVRYALGSGTRGRAYLIERDGYLFQSPISWYAAKHLWDLAPGYQGRNYHFQRMVKAECLFCHSNQVEPVASTFNRYREPIFRGYAIGCERCHGPGALHVQRQEAGEPAADPDDTIVNPARLPPALREAVCQQCHLQGESPVVRRGRQLFDFRPGLPLHLFLAVFVRLPELADKHKAVSHVRQMYVSRCFRASQGRMGCISCHDPHGLPAPAEKAAYYRGRCLACHTARSCSLPPDARRQKDQADACTACHMAPLANLDIAHTAQTDHRLLRRPDATPPLPAAWLRAGVMPLVPFHADLADPTDGDAARDLGLALVQLTEAGLPDTVGLQLLDRALPALEAALRHAPEDVAAWHAKGSALRIRGRKEEALAALEAGLARAPDHEVSLVEAAGLAAELGRDEAALAYGQRALAVNPWSEDAHALLARFLAGRRRYPIAAEHCRAVLRLNPANEAARRLLVACYLALGQGQQAQAEFQRLLAFEPPDQEQLRRWFARLPHELRGPSP